MNQNYLPSNLNLLLELNEFIHKDNDRFESHMKHIKLVATYAQVLNQRLGNKLDNNKLAFIAFAHDLFKDRSLHPEMHGKITWRKIMIPQDSNRYIRMNLDTLEIYGLDDYFNSSMTNHAIVSGIFLRKALGVTDIDILYSIFFHSCPIMNIYERLPENTRQYVDIIMLADKLSSNYVKINYRNKKTRIDLDLVVFGESGYEFNYTLGLFLARVIGQGNDTHKESVKATNYFYNRLCRINPLLAKKYSVKNLGGSREWAKRKSKVWEIL